MVASVAAAPPVGAFEYDCKGDAAKCPSVRCSGDETACQLLNVDQDGVDHETGAHIVVGFRMTPGMKPQAMNLVLTVGEKLSDCSGSAREIYANANDGDFRSIDGLLCSVRATWVRF